jgi:hypothetical protein
MLIRLGTKSRWGSGGTNCSKTGATDNESQTPRYMPPFAQGHRRCHDYQGRPTVKRHRRLHRTAPVRGFLAVRYRRGMSLGTTICLTTHCMLLKATACSRSAIRSALCVCRDLRGMTHAALDEKAGVGPVTVAEIGTGRKLGAVSAPRALAHPLGVSLDNLAK